MNTKEAISITFWEDQVEQFDKYNNAPNTPAQVAMHPNVTVSDITFSHNPTGNEKPFTDGIWLKQYNGASGGNWMAWKNIGLPQGTAPYWKNNNLNGVELLIIKIVNRPYVKKFIAELVESE